MINRLTPLINILENDRQIPVTERSLSQGLPFFKYWMITVENSSVMVMKDCIRVLGAKDALVLFYGTVWGN
jgi:hypothetical protein